MLVMSTVSLSTMPISPIPPRARASTTAPPTPPTPNTITFELKSFLIFSFPKSLSEREKRSSTKITAKSKNIFIPKSQVAIKYSNKRIFIPDWIIINISSQLGQYKAYIPEPSKIYNIDDKGILNCCRGNDFSAGKDLNTGEKLFWMYTDDYNKLNKREVIKYLIDKKVKEYTENISGKAVYCTTTNEVFNSIMDAVRAYGGNESGIRKCCRGEIKTSGTLRNGTRLTWVFLKDYVEINNMTMEEFVIQHHYSSFLLE